MPKKILVVILVCGFLAAQAGVQSVRWKEIRSPLSARCGDRWVLYGIADCELHAFVDADGRKNVQRLYWVQFEGYLPTKPASSASRQAQ